MEKQSFIKDKTFNRFPTKYPISCQMHKKSLIIALVILLSIGLFVVADVVLTSDNSTSPDADFSNTKVITLNITGQDNFERLIDVNIDRINDTRFLINLQLNETLLADIQTCRALTGASKLTCFGNIKTTYFSDITLQDILDSLNNIASFPATNLTTGITLEKNSMDLSTGSASFYVDLVDYNPADLTKSVGKRFKVGLHSITIETVESTNDVGWNPSIALDSNGKAHILQFSDTDDNIRYCNNTASDGSWSCKQITTGTITTGHTPSSIAINSSNGIHISYLNNYCQIMAGTGSYSCSNYHTASGVDDSSIAIDSNNKVHIASLNNTDFIYCNNTASDGSWSCANVDSVNSVGHQISLVLDSNNIPHVTYFDYSDDDLIYSNRTGGTWTKTIIEDFGSITTLMGTSITMENNGIFHLAYDDTSVGTIGYCNNTGGSWSCTDISLGSNGNYPTIKAINGRIFISTIGVNNILYLAKKNSPPSSWNIYNLGGFDNNDLGAPTRWMELIKGRLVDSTAYSNFLHFSIYNNTDLIYLKVPINLSIYLLKPVTSDFYNTGTNLHLNLTIDNSSVTSCLYSLDNYATNTSIANCQNTTFTTTDGAKTLLIYANDSAGNVDNTSVSFTIDSTFPLISFSSTQDANNTNFSRNWIFINTTSTEINFANITYRIANSTNITTAVYTSYTNTSNFTGRVDGVYSYNVTIVDLATNSNTTETRTIRLDNTVPSISVFDPDPVTYASNQSIPLNFTSSDAVVGLANSTFQVLNASGGAVIVANTTLTGNVTFNVTKEWTYNFTLWSTDLLNQIGRVDVQFSVDMTGPAVVLDSPASNANLSNGTNTYLNFTATKTGGISQCQMWGNFTGSWHKNYTWETITTAVQNFTTLNFSNSNNLWNVWCNDTADNQRWALNNLTFLVDLTYPNVSIDSITTTAGSQTISFNSTQTDTYGTLNTCKYSIYDSTDSIDGTNENVSMTCNSNPHSATVSSYATYKLRVYAIDYANNENSTNLSFTTSATAGGTVTGGGGGGTPLPEDTGFCGDNICREDRGETFNSCPEDCAQLNFNFDSFLFNCLDGKENDCFWERNTGLLFGVLFLVGFLLFSLLFKIEPEKKGIKKVVYVPPKIFKKRR